MTAESAIRILRLLQEHDVSACVGGGWAIDALLKEQTRVHADLDLWILATEAEPLLSAAAKLGIDRILPWPGDRPWNFVLQDGAQLRIDLHFYEPLPGDQVHYGRFVGGDVFPAAALAGRGRIGDTELRCETPEWSLRWHTGYPPRAEDHHDVPLLCQRFGLELPEIYRD